MEQAHTKRYDGEWVDDVPTCGSYTEMPPDELAPASQVCVWSPPMETPPLPPHPLTPDELAPNPIPAPTPYPP